MPREIYAEFAISKHPTLSVVMLNVVMVNVVMLSIIMLSVVVLSVVILSVLMLSVAMMNVVAPTKQIKKFLLILFVRGHRIPKVTTVV
jgi:hypothetical protein